MAVDRDPSSPPPDSKKNGARKYPSQEILGLSSRLQLCAGDSHDSKSQQSELTTTLANNDSPTDFREVSEASLSYITVPSDHRTSVLAKTRTWHVLLISQDLKHPPLPLRIVGDVVLGRKAAGVNPDIDLNPYEPGLLGVSRTHAMFRPTHGQLLLTDLGSTNGTSLNGERLRLGRPGNVLDQSVISLGRLHFKVRIMRNPEENMR